MKVQFVKGVSSELFERTAAAWLEWVKANPTSTSASYYESKLAYFRNVVAGTVLTGDGGGCLCGIILEDDDYASALIVVSHAKAKKDLRMIDVAVEPALNVADVQPNFQRLAWIASTAIIECLDMTYSDYPSENLKMLAEFPLDNEFMAGVTFLLDKAKFTVSRQGNWLTVSKIPGGGAARPGLRVVDAV